jgi:WD40 repeat protein
MNACKELYEVLHSHGSGNRFCFTRDCCQLVVASDCDLSLYDALSGILLKKEKLAFKFSYGIASVRPVGARILTVLDDILRIWNANLEESVNYELENRATCACVSPLEDILVVALNSGSAVILDAFTLMPMNKFTLDFGSERPRAAVQSLQVNEAGTRLLTEFTFRLLSLHVYDLSSGIVLFQLTSSAKVCFSFDFQCIYGSSLKGLLCWEAGSGSAIECPFSSTRGRPDGYRVLQVFGESATVILY